MRKLSKKIQVSLFLFLGLCSLIVNGVAFLILADYHSNHYKELAEAHMEQQYQNSHQRLAVYGEQIRLFGEDTLLVREITEEKWSEVDDRITAFAQSFSAIESLRIYYENEQGLSRQFVRGYGNTNIPKLEPSIVTQYWERAGKRNQNEIWFLREGQNEGYECLSYLMPLLKDGERVGFLLADIPVSTYMNTLTTENASLWEEHFVISSEETAWYSSHNIRDSFDAVQQQPQEGLQVLGDQILYTQELTETGNLLIQIISLKTGQLLFPTAVSFTIIFLCSLVFIYFGVRKISRTITVPLNEIEQKLTNTVS